LDSVAVYEIDHSNNHKHMIESQNLATIKNQLPIWLQIAIDDATFKPDHYQHKKSSIL